MKHASKLLGVVSMVALASLGANTAHAAGTAAGTTITNTVSVAYTVGGVAQTAVSASNNVTVDRKVNLTMTGAATTTSVSPGQTVAVTTYTLTNTSNDTLDFALSAVNQATGATAAHGGTDAFDVGAFTYYVDTNNNGVYDAGTDTAVTYIDELAADAAKTIFVVSSVPIGATNGQVSGVVLTATAEAGGAAGTQGAVLTATAGANTAGVDTVFADTAGATDAANDGKYSAKGDYTIAAPVLTVQKLATIISDPIDGTTNPKAIPGAVVEYCIVVQNGAGGATASGIAISDPLPSTVAYSAPYGIYLNGTVTGGVCNADGAINVANSSYTPAAGVNPAQVAGTLNNVTGGNASTLRFRVTIN